MQPLTNTLTENHNLFFFGDLHLGTILHHKDGIQQFIDTMNSPYEDLPAINNWAINMGDNIEAIMMDDPRYSPETTDQPFPLQQIEDIVHLLQPISTKILTILQGNHERKLWRFGDITQMICNKLGVPYGTFTAKITITNQKDTLLYKVFATHGRKSITSTADDPKRRLVNQRLILKRHLKFKSGDAVIMAKAHTHKLLVCSPEEELYLVDDGQKIQQRYISSSQNAPYIHPDHRWYISTGGFLKLYGQSGVSGYAEVAEFDPLELGYCVALVRNAKIQEIKRVVL